MSFFTPFAFVKTAASTVPTSNFLLNDYPGAYAAYSLRKLKSDYAGAAIQVRRSSDGNTQDIGFVNNVLDTASLLTFVGSGDGFLYYWYDQSGNARDLEQTSNGAQPRIVLAGTIDTLNGKPTSRVTGSSTMVFNTPTGNNTIPSSFFTVFGPTNNSSTSYFGMGDISGNPPNAVALGNRGTTQTVSAYFSDGILEITNGLSSSNETQYLAANINIDESATGRKLFVNSTNEYTSTQALFNQFVPNIRLNPNNIGQGSAKWQEMVIWKSNQSSNRSGIESNINSFYSIY